MDIKNMTTEELRQRLRADFLDGDQLPEPELMAVLDELVERDPPAPPSPYMDAFIAYQVGKISLQEYAGVLEQYGKEYWLQRPSWHGEDCLANGEHEGVEIQCDECDHYLTCFPDWRVTDAEREELVRQVAGSMALSGFTLSEEDKDRIRNYAFSSEKMEQILAELIEKHTARRDYAN